MNAQTSMYKFTDKEKKTDGSVVTYVLSELYAGVRQCSDELCGVHVVNIICTRHIASTIYISPTCRQLSCNVSLRVLK